MKWRIHGLVDISCYFLLSFIWDVSFCCNDRNIGSSLRYKESLSSDGNIVGCSRFFPNSCSVFVVYGIWERVCLEAGLGDLW